MQNQFNLYSSAQAGLPHPPAWNYVRDGLQHELKTITEFYRSHTTGVNSEHFLVRLIQSIGIPISLDIERYFNNVDAVALNLATSLKMTSTRGRGNVFNGVFYGKNSVEVLIATEEDFNIHSAEKNWQQLRPVTVLRHSISDLSLKLPDGSDFFATPQVSIFAINIGMLAVQYRSFVKAEMDDSDYDAQRTVMNFVRMYVLPNMLYSQLDRAIFNRAVNMLAGMESDSFFRAQPFYITDFTQRVDIVLNGILRGFTDANKDFVTILRSVPMVDVANGYELSIMPDVAPTMQVVWAVVLAALVPMNFLTTISHENPGNRNQSDISRWLRMYNSYAIDRVFSATRSMNNILYQQAKKDIETFEANVTSS